MPFYYRPADYYLEVQWTLMWFPVRGNAPLSTPKIRAGRLGHSSNEDALNSPGIGGGTAVVHLLGQALSASDEGLAPDNLISGFMTVRLTYDALFEVEPMLQVPGAQPQQRIVMRPDQRVPFMLTAHPQGNRAVADTGAVFHGVLATSAMRSILQMQSMSAG